MNIQRNGDQVKSYSRRGHHNAVKGLYGKVTYVALKFLPCRIYKSSNEFTNVNVYT